MPLALGGVSSAATITGGSSLLVDFNSPTDADDFVVAKASPSSPANLDFNNVAGQGVGGSGAGVWGPSTNPTGPLSSGANDGSALYAPAGLSSTDGLIDVGVGETFTTSVKINLDTVGIGAVPSIGFVAEETIDPNNPNQISGTNNLNSTANSMSLIFRFFQGAHRLTLRNAGFDAQSIDTNDSNTFTPVANEWYELRMIVEKTPTANTFNVTGQLDRLSADGTSVVEANFREISAVYESASLYTDEWRGGLQYLANPSGNTLARVFDEFSVSVTPEPSSIALLGLTVLGVAWRRP
ncbi:MAG: PEP-CTERM sorting domain-containing protein [Planctomycetota bacterium]